MKELNIVYCLGVFFNKWVCLGGSVAFAVKFEHMWYFAWLGTICTILRAWKTPMEECYF